MNGSLVVDVGCTEVTTPGMACWAEPVVRVWDLLTLLKESHHLVEWIDSQGNWSDGLSRALAKEQFVVDHGFETEEITPDMAWWSGPLVEVWDRLTFLLLEQALDGE